MERMDKEVLCMEGMAMDKEALPTSPVRTRLNSLVLSTARMVCMVPVLPRTRMGRPTLLRQLVGHRISSIRCLQRHHTKRMSSLLNLMLISSMVQIHLRMVHLSLRTHYLSSHPSQLTHSNHLWEACLISSSIRRQRQELMDHRSRLD